MVLFSKGVATGLVGVLFSKGVVSPSVTTGPAWYCSNNVWLILL